MHTWHKLDAPHRAWRTCTALLFSGPPPSCSAQRPQRGTLLLHQTATSASPLAAPRRFAVGYWGYGQPNNTGGGVVGAVTGVPAVSIISPVLTAVLALLLALAYELRRHLEHRNLFGKVGGGAGDAVCLSTGNGAGLGGSPSQCAALRPGC